MSDVDKGLVTELVYGVLRQRESLDFAIRFVVSKRPKDLHPSLLRILRLGVYQILFLRKIPAAAAVSTTVEICKRMGKGTWASLANASLKRLAERKDELHWPDWESDPIGYLTVIGSHQRWLAELFFKQIGSKSKAFVEAGNRPARVCLRSRQGDDLTAIQTELASMGIRSEKSGLVKGALRLERPGTLGKFAFLKNARAAIQDEASQLITFLLDPEPGTSLLDVCAAPGGKTFHAADLMKDSGKIIALDLYHSKIEAMDREAARLGLESVRTMQADMSVSLPKEFEKGFEQVLVDAPCSNTGTLRRHPEKRWRLKKGDLESLSKLQSRILSNAAGAVKPKGVLVYSVCSITRQEGEDVISGFLDEHPEFCIEPPVDRKRISWQPFLTGQGMIRTWPHEHDMDGFFAARLRRLE